MTDELTGESWTLAPELRTQLRLERVRRRLEEGAWAEAAHEAEELLDGEPDHTEALALLGRALLELQDGTIARLALEQCVALGHDADDVLMDLAVARFETCDLPGAAELAREVTRRDPARAEAHWYLGLSLERLEGRQAEALAALAAARQLAPERYPWPLELDAPTWEQTIREAAALLPDDLQAFWSGVPIQLVEQPDLDELRRMDPPASPAVTGLYAGSPGEDPARSRPVAMRLFRRNLALCRDLDELREVIAEVLEAEAHGWLGAAPEGEPGPVR